MIVASSKKGFQSRIPYVSWARIDVVGRLGVWWVALEYAQGAAHGA
jgi:hypothetical protein